MSTVKLTTAALLTAFTLLSGGCMQAAKPVKVQCDTADTIAAFNQKLAETTADNAEAIKVAWQIQGDVQVSQPFVGIKHIQIIQKNPRPTVISALEIDPKADGVEFYVTPDNGDPNGDEPGDPNYETTRMTVREFVDALHAQAGINAAFYAFIPGTNDTNVISLGVSDGNMYSPFAPQKRDFTWPAINFGPDNKANVVNSSNLTKNTPIPAEKDVQLYNAISGSHILVKDGKPAEFIKNSFNDTHHPRTAAGVTFDGKVILITVDGRQPDFSEGASLTELAQMLVQMGVKDAVNLDGGGSTTMVLADGPSRVINYPSDAKGNGESGKERANGANIAVFAKPNPNYSPLAAAPKPKPLAPLPYPSEKVVIEDFENGPGNFSRQPINDGASYGINKKKSSVTMINTDAPVGSNAQELTIVRDKGFKKGLYFRHLSNGGNTNANKVLGRIGTIGYWARTTTPNLRASIIIDDTIQPDKNTCRSHERGRYLPLTPDGKWHFYAWDLQKVHHWNNYFNGNGSLEGPNTSVDAIFIGSDPKFNKEGEVLKVEIDGLTYDPHGDFE